jgi:hypothetical protein
MNIAFLIGRIIFAMFWLMGSFNHFKNLNYMSEYAKARGTPSPKLAVGGKRSDPAAGWSQHVAGRLSCGWDYSADCLSAGRVVSDALLLESGRRADEADRHDQLHQEYGACGGTLDVLAAAPSVADESGDRVGHTACAGGSMALHACKTAGFQSRRFQNRPVSPTLASSVSASSSVCRLHSGFSLSLYQP